MRSEDRNKFYLEKMEEEYTHLSRSFIRATSYEVKVINSKTVTAEELELLQLFDDKFRKKIKHFNNLLDKNPLKKDD